MPGVVNMRAHDCVGSVHYRTSFVGLELALRSRYLAATISARTSDGDGIKQVQ